MRASLLLGEGVSTFTMVGAGTMILSLAPVAFTGITVIDASNQTEKQTSF